MTSTSFVLTGAQLFDAEGGLRPGSIVVDRGTIRAELPPASPIPEGLPVVPLAGRVLLPSFCDGHCHLTFVGLQKVRLDLSAARSKAEALDLLRAGLTRTDLPETILAEGWDESTWPIEDGPLDRRELDSVSTLRTIVARRACTHIAVANSKALPCFTSFDRIDSESGRLYEAAAMHASRVLPGLGAERDRALACAIEEALRQGVTEIHEFGKREDFELLTRAMEEDELPLRVRFFMKHEEWSDPGVGEWTLPSRGDFRFAGVKFFTDGSFGARTAALHEPYLAGGYGEILWEEEALVAAYRKVHDAGLATATHAIGDRALDLTSRALARAGTRGDRIEHVELASTETRSILASLEVTLSMQPNFVARWAGIDGLYERVLGRERARGTNAFATLRGLGRRLAFGSDSMPMGPLFGLRGAVRHPAPSERLDLATALRAYTRSAREAAGDPRGRLAAGESADLVILGTNVFDADAVLDSFVEATAIAGSWHFVHANSSLDLPNGLRAS
jgi:predicted amidohydrolase YtcJ